MALNFKQFIPWEDDFDLGKAAKGLLTGGLSSQLELGGEAIGEGLKKGLTLTGKGLGTGARIVGDGFEEGLTGSNKKEMSKPKQEATRELFDPRRRGGKTPNFASLTQGQFNNQPSLIG